MRGMTIRAVAFDIGGVLEITRLDQVIPIFDDEADAVAAVGSGL